jgi:hypothetical protein
MLRSDVFRRNVVLSFQEDAIGIRLSPCGADYPNNESTFPRSRKILSEILESVPEG